MKYVFILILAFVIYQIVELNRFNIKKIKIQNSRIKHGGHFVFLSDVHGHAYGKKSRLVRKIRQLQPEIILLGGDIISKERWEQCETMTELILDLTSIAPVYYIFGNHETKMEQMDSMAFANYIENLIEHGVKVIRNMEFTPFRDNSISCYGLELPLELYEKGKTIPFPHQLIEQIKKQWNNENKSRILFVHQPSFAEDYALLNVDGIFCGHTHGGLVRIPWIGSILNPELIWFPKYDGGIYRIGEKKETLLAVSQGLGTHHFHLRVLDSAQLLDVQLCPCQDEKN